mgnify:CR=1 FL=1|tara:strand:- start:255 stop:989 length:735 start_codon:yes stop_codon:yes gene_type:complete
MGIFSWLNKAKDNDEDKESIIRRTPKKAKVLKKEKINDPDKVNPVFSKKRVEDRTIDELIGISRGIVFDNIVTQKEAEGLHKWLIANSSISDNPILINLTKRIEEMLDDDFLDNEESKELLELLTKFSGSDFELGELLKSTELPLDNPIPEIIFDNKTFCFTGTFAFGSRKKCVEEITKHNGLFLSGVSKKIDFLVIGIYATDAWMHSSYGRKIEKAVELKSSGSNLKIVSEKVFVEALGYDMV